ncbi:MAG: hypothetical protein MZW92_63410 [Comamonadaceae bacterium]|nr:hypothetical protein [Comamonadaceae bacterium]
MRESTRAPRGAVATSRPAAWRCGGSCSDPHQPAAAPRGEARASASARSSSALGAGRGGRPAPSSASGTPCCSR